MPSTPRVNVYPVRIKRDYTFDTTGDTSDAERASGEKCYNFGMLDERPGTS